MLSQIILWSGVGLEALLLWRGFKQKLTVRYPIFYLYIAFIFVQSLLRFSVHQIRPDLYATFYWSTDIINIAIGSLVVFEIYKIGLVEYPGASQLARKVLALVFAIAASKAIASTWNDPSWLTGTTLWDIELALRIVQLTGIAALVALFLFYRIPFGKNLRGVLVAYGLYVSVTAVQLAFLSTTEQQNPVFLYFGALTYFVALLMWVTHLWTYQPNPQPRQAVRLERDYQQMAAATRQRLRDARVYLHRVAR